MATMRMRTLSKASTWDSKMREMKKGKEGKEACVIGGYGLI